MGPIHRTIAFALVACIPFALVSAQSPSSSDKPAAQSTPRTDLYHVLFIKAAAGKARQLEENFKKPDPTAPMPGHALVLRHQDGSAWDYAVIEHLGTKATLDAARPQLPPEQRNLGDWHIDTYVTGPSWAHFTKAMGIDDAGKAKTADAVYVVSTYRSTPDQRDALEQFLSEPPDRPSDTSAGEVLMQHFEGADWNFLALTRYNSWQEFATNESNSVKQDGWFRLRELIAEHTDTITVRIAP
jgi:hypothetical protein